MATRASAVEAYATWDYLHRPPWVEAGSRVNFLSRQQHCASCLEDQALGYDDADEACCCVHSEEWAKHRILVHGGKR